MAVEGGGLPNLSFTFVVPNTTTHDMVPTRYEYKPNQQLILPEPSKMAVVLRRATVPASGIPLLGTDNIPENTFFTGFLSPSSSIRYGSFVPELDGVYRGDEGRIAVETITWTNETSIFTADFDPADPIPLQPSFSVDLSLASFWSIGMIIKDICYDSTSHSYWLLLWNAIDPVNLFGLPTTEMCRKQCWLYTIGEDLDIMSLKLVQNLSNWISSDGGDFELSSIWNMQISRVEDGSPYRYLMFSYTRVDPAIPDPATRARPYFVLAAIHPNVPGSPLVFYGFNAPQTMWIGASIAPGLVASRHSFRILLGPGFLTNPSLGRPKMRIYYAFDCYNALTPIESTNGSWFPTTASWRRSSSAAFYSGCEDFGFEDPPSPAVMPVVTYSTFTRAELEYLLWYNTAVPYPYVSPRNSLFSCPETGVYGFISYTGSLIADFDVNTEADITIDIGVNASGSTPNSVQFRRIKIKTPVGVNITQHRMSYPGSSIDWYGSGHAGFDTAFYAYSPDGISTNVVMTFRTDKSGIRQISDDLPHQSDVMFRTYVIKDVLASYPIQAPGDNWSTLILDGTAPTAPSVYNFANAGIMTSPVTAICKAERVKTISSGSSYGAGLSFFPYLHAMNSALATSWKTMSDAGHNPMIGKPAPSIQLDMSTKFFTMMFPTGWNEAFPIDTGVFMNAPMARLFEFDTQARLGPSAMLHLELLSKYKKKAIKVVSPILQSSVGVLRRIATLLLRRPLLQKKSILPVKRMRQWGVTDEFGEIFLLRGPMLPKVDGLSDLTVSQSYNTFSAWTNINQILICMLPAIFYAEQLNVNVEGMQQRAPVLTSILLPSELLPGQDVQYIPVGASRFRLIYVGTPIDTITLSMVMLTNEGEIIDLMIPPGRTAGYTIEFVPLPRSSFT